jgi:hypothetical protein
MLKDNLISGKSKPWYQIKIMVGNFEADYITYLYI